MRASAAPDWLQTDFVLSQFSSQRARAIAIALANLSGQHTMAAIVDHFGIHYTTVSRLVKAYESNG